MNAEQHQQILALLESKYSPRETTNFELYDFVYAHGSPLDAFMYLGLFWPTFVEFEDMVFHPSVIEFEDDREKILSCLEKYDGDRSRVEASFNIFEEGVLNYPPAFPEDLCELLEYKIMELWQARLATQFPQRQFEFHIASESDGFWGFWFHCTRD